ncbi:uncharacterized protein Z519_12478 [Cladophialophora bantiana CBS 173.52]|uniref:Uncharacterized protein n=1 Tax=Cladophialophora bantiana (strain ATCC 10958 / CBS 173.52 / CDC B-1940 / NIH 8579) TaxID=1442370 RepID=A0A0D2FJI2_CLAB1|nr:uncharacterized protein Z519_12478 [Cladophialophora bantiana CBS 173.52]KIW86857.1 hypothetical protein Z519_12478 [Cladophialophora bantiana CBS 173.52]
MASNSPKRKRGFPHPLDTEGPLPRLLNESDLEEYDEGSPRSKVARKFNDLEIHGHQAHEDQDASMEQNDQVTIPPILSAEVPGQERRFSTPMSNQKPETRTNVAGGPAITAKMSSGPASRSTSPPLAGEKSNDFWQDFEITGHDPDDPSDDGYGINGIGFKPTAAIAWSRSQRRKQQLSDYKNREAREARQQRSERRKRLFDEGEDALSVESSPRKAARVHFEDG